jgi:hypothetical protein
MKDAPMPRRFVCTLVLVSGAVLAAQPRAPGMTGALCAAEGPPAAEGQSLKETWAERVLPWTRKVPEGAKTADGKEMTPRIFHAGAARKLRAELDWQRRAAVCQKLRALAAQSGDVELDRFAERLDQRAWDAYIRLIGPNGIGAREEGDRDTPGGAGRAAAKREREDVIHEVRP